MAGNQDMVDGMGDEEWREQVAKDDLLMAQAINSADPQEDGGALGAAVSRLFGGEAIDQRGKADDAIDFEDMDLSDDDLPDGDPAAAGNAPADLPALTDDGGTSNDTDDLFGDPHDPHDSSPVHHGPLDLASSPRPTTGDAGDRVDMPSTLPGRESLEDLRALNFDHDDGPAGTNQDPNIPPPAENPIELVKQLWPGFEEEKLGARS
ncbi:hypothetical protein P8C59_008190 [Phyllachora maydis]|uniref:Uncharacterized protein n=1 Tax=Phyllachora maydis TaxID=1825666 RepID=A0AAD9MEY9_9PEZI|nr:hypothetical protein P8C59_008190 [Phyllachora maydis]